MRKLLILVIIFFYSGCTSSSNTDGFCYYYGAEYTICIKGYTQQVCDYLYKYNWGECAAPNNLTGTCTTIVGEVTTYHYYITYNTTEYKSSCTSNGGVWTDP